MSEKDKEKDKVERESATKSAQGMGSSDLANESDSEAVVTKKKGSKAKSSAKNRTRTSTALIDSLNTPQGKVLTTGAISVLASATLFFLAIAPALGSITNQLEINSRLREKIANMQAKQETLQYLTERELQQTEAKDEFDDLFGEDKHQDEIYQDVLAAVSASRLQFRGLNIEMVDGIPAKYTDLSISPRHFGQQVRVTVEGELTRLTSLVQLLETNKRILDIIDINVSVPDVNDQSTVLIEINMLAQYWVVDAEQLII